MARIRAHIGPTGAEQIQFDQRARALGLKVEDGQVDTQTAQGLKGGASALLEVLDRDGTLDAEGLSKLRQNKGFVASLLGRDLPIDEKRSRDVRALAMDMNGAALCVSRTDREARRSGEIDNHRMHFALDKVAGVLDRFNHIFAGRFSEAMATLDPKAAAELGRAVEQLAIHASDFQVLLSECRGGVVAAFQTGKLTERTSGQMLQAMTQMTDVSEELHRLAEKLGAPKPKYVPRPIMNVDFDGRRERDM